MRGVEGGCAEQPGGGDWWGWHGAVKTCPLCAHRFGRFEANYVAVLSHQETDRLKRGMQLGFASSAFMQ